MIVDGIWLYKIVFPEDVSTYFYRRRTYFSIKETVASFKEETVKKMCKQKEFPKRNETISFICFCKTKLIIYCIKILRGLLIV